MLDTQLELWFAFHFLFVFVCLLTDCLYLISIDCMGILCTCSHRKHSHLCNYTGLFLGLWKQWRLQLAAVVKEITELLSSGLLVICWPSMHTGDGAALLNGITSLLGCSRNSLLPFIVSILFSQRLAKGLKGFSLLEKKLDWFHTYL